MILKKPKKKFCDAWYNALPMDNEVSDTIIPIQFSELWIPLEKTKEVMLAWKEHVETHGIIATHAIFTEVYPAKETLFWMSPSYKKTVVRLDFCWYEKNVGDSKEWYRQFYNKFLDFGYSHHWGKVTCENPQYLKKTISKMG